MLVKNHCEALKTLKLVAGSVFVFISFTHSNSKKCKTSEEEITVSRKQRNEMRRRDYLTAEFEFVPFSSLMETRKFWTKQ